MKVSKTFLFVFLIIMSLCMVNTKPVIPQSSGTIYIRSDGSVEGTDKIQRDGNFYTFTGDISDSIVVERDNIVIDGAGYTLQGNSGGKGIDLSHRRNVTIKNMKILNFSSGIFLRSYAQKNIVYGNYIANNGNGIAFYDSNNNSITDNELANNEIGIHTFMSHNNTIYNNLLLNNTKHVYDYIWNQPWYAFLLSDNIWDDGEKGNYWDDYENRYPNATELDDSGIWDTPYFIDEKNQDYYPLVLEFPDTTPPAISIASPENKRYTTTDVPLNFTVTESVSWIAYSLDGQTNVTITGNTTLTGLSEGFHFLRVYANDTFGYTGTSETICFSVSQPEPFPTWIVAAIMIIAMGGVAFLVYFRKIKKTTGEEKRARPEGVM